MDNYNTADKQSTEKDNTITNRERIRYLMINAVILLIIVGLGLFFINQYVNFRYSMVLMKAPCQLCANQVPAFAQCVANIPSNISVAKNNYTIDINLSTIPTQ